VWPITREQRCWVHKTANILNNMPKSLHTKAKRSLQETDDLDAPMAEIGRNLIPDFGPLDAAALPPSGEALVYPAGEAASAATDDCRQCLHLPVVGMIINVEAGDPSRLSRPEVALPTADPHKAEIIELNIAVMALADAPEQHRFTKAVIRRLGKGARAWKLRSCSCRTSRRRCASSECRSSGLSDRMRWQRP
jgi:hypothetical protein